MSSSYELMSLFEQRPRARGGMIPYALSMVMHGGGIALGAWALIHVPMVRPAPIASRYDVRELKLHMPDRAPNANDLLYPHPAQPPAPAAKGSTDRPQPPAPSAQETAKSDAPPLPPLPREGGINKQILMQPKLHLHDQLAEKVPVPMAIMWMPELNHTKLIVPARPMPAVQAVVPPSLAAPNEELDMADLSISASDLQPKVDMPVPSTTSPLEQKGSDLVKLPPTTESVDPAQPTPTAVLSISSVRMPEGIAVLPPVNETGTGSTTAGAGAQPAGNGIAAAGQAGGNGSAHGTGGSGSGAGNGAGAGAASGASSTSAQASGSESVDHIQLAPNGRFGVVVVGSATTGQYPEAAQIWSDRVAYTVYLHVGLPRTWILQYGLERGTQANGTGAVGRLDAPWPYDIFRPNLLATDVDADALMVHGVLNTSGRLEQLAVAFPEGFPRASFVVNALSRWQFRPASQDGKP
ncbi:MAG TPA: hypothetical protein VMU71_10325, partial [Terracidiphilus sp.]|nr:hypothetical protein [Terracidiphilus sp.]